MAMTSFPPLRLRARPTLTSDFTGAGGGNFSHAGATVPKGWVEASGCYVMDTALSKDGSKLAAAVSTKFTVRLYDTRGTLAPIATCKGHKNRVTGVVFPSENDMFSCSEDGWVHRWDARANCNKPAQRMHAPGKNAKLTSLDVGCGDNVVVAGTSEGTDSKAMFWDVRSGSVLGKYVHGHTDAISQVKFDPLRSQYLLTGSLDGLICWYDASIAGEENAMLSVMNTESAVTKLGFFGPGNPCLYCINHTKDLSLWHIEKSAPMAMYTDVRTRLNVDFLIDCIYFEGQATQELWLASGTHLGSVGLSSVTLKDITPVYSLCDDRKEVKGHTQDVRCLSVAASDSAIGYPARIFTGGEDGLICDWGLKAGSASRRARKQRPGNRRAAPY